MIRSVFFILFSARFTAHAWLSRLHNPKGFRRLLGQKLDSEPIAPRVRFLGKGKHAVVRPGAILVAPKDEFHHYYRDAAIFVFAMGEDDETGDYVIRGVIIDHPTPFTLEEMMEGNTKLMETPLKNNFLFRGGDAGGEQVVLLHSHETIGQSAVGDSGVYQGGFDSAMQACKDDSVDPLDFKLFFNYCEFTEATLEEMLDSESEDDQWISVEVDSDFILDGEFIRGEACKRLRTIVKQQLQTLKP